ncbi:MAG: NAD-dependent dihydropyrimidine dehydrogenase subunit PreA [Candidatus Acetothermia bacterium]|jgi:dihydropyrimidine dehydrogenase (NAD+) subunit PreA|nr:NAD-dependent dihydropyrimidine dehydrogenase subunit PreA [Candidatus Acetothermia bacterium]MDH7504688.1 NAD-dependent dihydropyrimidine dehydrogenase subunit PreA [Candidatus Acetothermia bacterium]
MADLSIDFAGVKAPNPFWVSSGPPSNTLYQLNRAFEAGWGGFVWKTLSDPLLNVTNRYGGIHYGRTRAIGINNIELVSDRPREENLREIREAKRRWPDRALFVSAMVPSKREAWHRIVEEIQETGADGIELNFGCPHGMPERGMGAAVGQVPEYCEMITSWAKEVAKVPLMVKLTPNVTNIVEPARAAVKGGASALSMINTVYSIMGVDLDTLEIQPSVRGKGTPGGYAGPAVKPIGLYMVSKVARENLGVPISGIGGIESWRDAAEYILLGATSVQVCTGIMKYGFQIVKGMISGLSRWMDEKGFARISDFSGLAARKIAPFGELDIMYRTVAEIDYSRCIYCRRCYTACEDGLHQAIELVQKNGRAVPRIKEEECVGCRMCSLICPAQCIRMVERDRGFPSQSWSEIVAANPGIDSDWKVMRRWRKEHNWRTK